MPVSTSAAAARRWRCTSRIAAGRDRADPAGERVHEALAVGMHAVAEEDDEQLQLRIDPQHGAGEAAVAEGRVGQQLAAVDRIAGALVPAEAAEIDRRIGGTPSIVLREPPRIL